MYFEEWWESLSPAEFRMTLNMSDDERIKYFCQKAWKVASDQGYYAGIGVNPDEYE